MYILYINISDDLLFRTVGSERDGLHREGRRSVRVERAGSSDGILAGCLPVFFRYWNCSFCFLLCVVAADVSVSPGKTQETQYEMIFSVMRLRSYYKNT